MRPKHAATLIILHRDAGRTRVLMGERHGKHAFMPNALVFPGGAVDLCDHRLSCPERLSPLCEQRLAVRSRGANAKALALAAIRETFEETGLRVARRRSDAPLTRSPAWAEFVDGGYTPAVDRLAFVARAITPPGRPRRYDTRFFVTESDAIAGDPADFSGASGELGRLDWLDVDDVLQRDIRPVTLRGLRQALRWIETPAAERSSLEIPFVYMRGRERVRDQI